MDSLIFNGNLVSHLALRKSENKIIDLYNEGYGYNSVEMCEVLQSFTVSSKYNQTEIPLFNWESSIREYVREKGLRQPKHPWRDTFNNLLDCESVDYCGYLSHLDMYFLPSQIYCFGSNLSPVEQYPLWNSLQARSAHALSVWPSSRKSVINLRQTSGEVVRQPIDGDFHYLRFGAIGTGLMVQCTDYDLFCLTQHNPIWFGQLASFVGTGYYIFNVTMFTEISEMAQSWTTYELWNFLFYGTQDLIYMFNRFEDLDHASRFRKLVKKYITDLDYLYKMIELIPHLQPKFIPSKKDLMHVEIDDVIDWYQKRIEKIQNGEVTLQGLMDTFRTFTNNESREEILTSVNEIGKLAQTMNSMQSTFNKVTDNDWYKGLVSYLMSMLSYINEVANDFSKFVSNPTDYVTFLLSHAKIGIRVPLLTVYDASKTAFILAASIALFNRSNILSIGLFLYAVQSFLDTCMYSDIARPCALVITLCYIGIMKAIQLRSASIEIQGPNNLTEMIYATVTFVTLACGFKGATKAPKGIIKHLFDSTKDLFAISKGTLALSKCVEFVIDAFKRCVEFCFGDTFMYQALVKMSVTSDDLKDYIVYAMSTKAEDLTAKLTLDQEAKKEWYKMCEHHNSFLSLFASGKPPTENHIAYSMYSKACASFIKLQEEYEKIKDSLDYFRVEPFMVWLWGEPGVGKTWCRDAIVNNMYAWHKAMDPTLDARRVGLLYVRNPADKYMSKYKGQFAVAYDDVGQNRQADNPEFNELMGFGSTNQVQLNMADLQDKGRMFSSKVIIMAANTKNVNANELLLSPNAFNRRRHVLIHLVRPKLENSESLATSKCDFTKVRIELSDPILGSDLAKFPNEGFGDNEEMFTRMFRWLAPKYWEHVKSQSDALAKKEQNLKDLLDGKPDAQVVHIDPNTGKVLDIAPQLPSEEEIVQEEYYDTVDSSPSDLVEKQKLYEKVRLYRAVSKEFDEVCSLISVTNNPTELLRLQFDSLCKKGLGRVLSTEEFIRIFKKKEFTMDPETLLSLKDYWESIAEQKKNEFPWLKILGALSGIVTLVSCYKLLKSLFAKDDKDLFSMQGYSLETRAPRSNPVVIQESNHEEIYKKFDALKQYARIVTAPGYAGTEADKKKLLNDLDLTDNNYKFDDILLEKYESQVLAPRSVPVTIQQDEIDNIDQVCLNLSYSFGRFSKVRDVKEGFAVRSMNGFNIAHKIWLIPRHFFGLTLEDTPILLQRDNKPPTELLLKKEKMIPYEIHTQSGIKTKDLILVEIDQLDSGRNHIKHFAKGVHLQNTKVFNSKMMKWNKLRNRVEEAYTGQSLRWDKPLDLYQDGLALHYSDGYSYGYKSEEGDCGSLLLSIDRTTNARIYGLHFGFDHSKGRGLSMNVPREDLEILVRYFPNIEKITAQKPEIVTQSCEVPLSLQQEDGTNYFEFLGKVEDAPLPPRKHKDLFRSPLFDSIYPAEKDLSVLTMFDKRMDPEYRGEPDILTRGVLDFEHKSVPWPEYELDIAQQALVGEFSGFTEVIDREVQSIDFALNGKWVDGQRLEFTEPLNLKTSAGYGLPGSKREHFVETDFLDQDGKLIKHDISILNPVLQKMVDNQWNDWMEGKTHPCIWSHALKSEPLKLSKIKTGNTRTFCVAQTAFLINVRRLFGSFTAAMKASKIKSFSCLGTDACSPDWNNLYSNLRGTGPKGVDLDFVKFDRTAVTWQLARRVCLAINKWYNDDEKNQRARLIAFEDMIFSFALIGKYLTRKRRGNPSGNPLTTELNNCVNYLMLCMVYLIIARHRKPTEFGIRQWKRNINMKAYGDDIIFTAHPECMLWFDLDLLVEIYKSYGVPVTPADKSDAGIKWKPLHELTFLKRTFVPFDHPYNKWQGALDKTSIRNMIQFYRLKPNNGTERDAVITNCEESLKEAYHWGREFYEDHKNKLNDWFLRNNYPIMNITFEELDFQFRDKIRNF